MNTDVSFIRGYIIRAPPVDVPPMTPSNYHRLLPRRQELTHSARKSAQTVTVIDQLQIHPNRSIANFNYSINTLPQGNGKEVKHPTPRELCFQLNAKLEYLIRTRSIERSRVINRTTIPPSTPGKSRGSSQVPTRESLNRTIISSFSQESPKTGASSSVRTTATSTVVAEELIEKESCGENDEAGCEEMVEEENINFLAPPP